MMKQLTTPITLLISISIKEYVDKTYSNTYCSARYNINHGEVNYMAMEYGSSGSIIETIRTELRKRGIPLPDYKSDYAKAGIYEAISIVKASQRDCKAWGTS